MSSATALSLTDQCCQVNFKVIYFESLYLTKNRIKEYALLNMLNPTGIHISRYILAVDIVGT